MLKSIIFTNDIINKNIKYISEYILSTLKIKTNNFSIRCSQSLSTLYKKFKIINVS
jgi:hypothetical protein